MSTQVRFAHTDITVPDFSDYRRDSVKDPKVTNSGEGRKAFTYLIASGKGFIEIMKKY